MPWTSGTSNPSRWSGRTRVSYLRRTEVVALGMFDSIYHDGVEFQTKWSPVDEIREGHYDVCACRVMYNGDRVPPGVEDGKYSALGIYTILGEELDIVDTIIVDVTLTVIDNIVLVDTHKVPEKYKEYQDKLDDEIRQHATDSLADVDEDNEEEEQ